jgi:hypothetical protein
MSASWCVDFSKREMEQLMEPVLFYGCTDALSLLKLLFSLKNLKIYNMLMMNKGVCACGKAAEK